MKKSNVTYVSIYKTNRSLKTQPCPINLQKNNHLEQHLYQKRPLMRQQDNFKRISCVSWHPEFGLRHLPDHEILVNTPQLIKCRRATEGDTG